MEQKAIIVTADITNIGLREVNEMLQGGEWKFVQGVPMPSSCSITGTEDHVTKMVPTCLVILQREEPI